jgi:RNA polymerase sigma-70 factor (sigma-E family)
MRDHTVEAEQDFEAFFHEGFGRTLRLALRIVPTVAEAEDVAAEAFARAYADWNRVGPVEHRLAWVLRVATNLAVDTVRPRRRRLLPLGIEAAGAVRDRSLGEDDLAIRHALVAALRRLPARQREAIALRYLADLSVDEVAHALGTAPTTVKTHLQRGLKSLRTVIGSNWEGEAAYGIESRA